MVFGWLRRDRPERSAADESLERLQQQASAPQPEPPPAAPPAPDDDVVARSHAHMERVSEQTEALLAGVPAEQRGGFMSVVGTVTDDPAGPVVVTTQHEGATGPGEAVALLVVADDPRSTAATELTDAESAELLLLTRARGATVVAWDPDTGRLQLTGIDPADLTAGSMIFR